MTGQGLDLQMGCYGIGVTRVVAAAIEQNHDERGIIWPVPLAPFDVALLPLNMAKSDKLKAAAEALQGTAGTRGIAVFMDDRDLRPGPMFADAELIGIPHRLVLSGARSRCGHGGIPLPPRQREHGVSGR